MGVTRVIVRKPHRSIFQQRITAESQQHRSISKADGYW